MELLMLCAFILCMLAILHDPDAGPLTPKKPGRFWRWVGEHWPVG